MTKQNPIGIVDIFAGPGGLSEGFSSVGSRSNPSFKTALSIEKDSAAHRTLRLRSLVHELDDREYEHYIEILNSEDDLTESLFEREFPEKWLQAESIARLHTLSEENRPQTQSMLDEVQNQYEGRTGLIGGPPCQVYSLVGRSRNAGNLNYQGDDDHRHTLYKEYIHVLEYLNPMFFVMENVKGMLSSKHQSQHIFPLVRKDLEDAGGGYSLFALAPRAEDQGLLPIEMMPIDHRDFIVRMEEFGVPQKRHRIIILGLRNDIAGGMLQEDILKLKLDTQPRHTVKDVLLGLPALRSGLSKGGDSPELWQSVVQQALTHLLALELDPALLSRLSHIQREFSAGQVPQSRTTNDMSLADNRRLMDFIRRDDLTRLHHHATRAHIAGDLARYIFAAAFTEAKGHSPRASEFPVELAPDHANWNSGHFNDRFRVQSWNDASSTITSHISKDGHYYIHPDPLQARSLTVREAARLQTFPDDYIFLGNRTEQFHQVGNAVPPYLACQIAMLLDTSISATQ